MASRTFRSELGIRWILDILRSVFILRGVIIEANDNGGQEDIVLGLIHCRFPFTSVDLVDLIGTQRYQTTVSAVLVPGF